jgi:hypothetical protein
MKKVLNWSPFILFLIYLFVPYNKFLSAFEAFEFSFEYPEIVISVYAALALIATVFIIILKIEFDKFNSRILPILFVMSVINGWVFFVLSDISVITNVSVAICVISSAVLAIVYSKNFTKLVSVIFVVIYIITIIPSSFMLLFAKIGETSIKETLYSQNGNYRAEFIEYDDGALGGSSAIKVYENSAVLDLFIFRFSKTPKIIYSGKFGDFDKISASWVDNDSLMFNSTFYDVYGEDEIIVGDFSYTETTKDYQSDIPGIKTSGFKNTEKTQIENAKQAILLATNECSIDYNQIQVHYDKEASIWRIFFYKEIKSNDNRGYNYSIGGYQTVYLDSNGITHYVVPGE